MTLYRLARHSKVVEALIEAAENGKQVDVLVELKTRFDEENNIEWSRQLEDAGCHVIYGLDGLKVHSKLCLITRKTEKGIDYITQIGTGNRGARIQEMFITMLSDNVKAREQQPDGTYVCLTPEENAPLNSQEYFFDAAYAAAENNNFR